MGLEIRPFCQPCGSGSYGQHAWYPEVYDKACEGMLRPFGAFI